MDSPYPTYDAVYNSGNPSLNAANLLNNTAIMNQVCSQCAQAQQSGGYTAISPQIANPPPPKFLDQPIRSGSSPAQLDDSGLSTNASNSGNTMSQGNFPMENPQLAVINDLNQGMPMTAESLQYLNGFIRTQIGRRVRVEFLIGTNTMTDRTGILVAVGANYILLNETETDDLLACDFYNIKFIKFYY